MKIHLPNKTTIAGSLRQWRLRGGIYGIFIIAAHFFLPISATAENPAEAFSDTVERLCPVLAGIHGNGGLTAVQQDVLFRCGEVKIQSGQNFDDLNADQLNALNNMTSTQNSAINTATVEIARPQATAISGRLAALRGSGVGGLALNLEPVDREPIYYAGPVTSLSADDGNSSMGADFDRFGIFVNLNGASGSKDDTDNEAGFDFSSAGIIAGADYRLTPGFFLGLAFGYSQTASDIDDDGGDVDVNGYGGSLYGTYYVNNFYLNGIATYGRKDYEIKRNLNYSIARNPNDPNGGATANVDQQFKGDTEADEYGFSLGAGYDFSFGGFGIGPYARLNYFRTDIDGYDEKLANANTNDGFGLALSIKDQEIESVSSIVGTQASYAINTAVGVWSPYLKFDWQHEYNDDATELKGSFANAGTDPNVVAENSIVIPLDNPDRDFFNLGLGISATFPRGFSAFVDYATVLALEDLTVHQIVGGLRIEL
jgi:outer membrane autotransporter protein